MQVSVFLFNFFALSYTLLACSKNSYSHSENTTSSMGAGRPVGEAGKPKPEQSSTSVMAPIQPPSEPGSGNSSPRCLVGPVEAPIIKEDLSTKVQIGTVLWRETKESAVNLVAGSTSYSQKIDPVSGESLTADGYPVLSDPLPPLSASGWHFDIQLLEGFSTTPKTKVAWLGVTHATTPFTWHQPQFFTGWYWSGLVWTPPPNDSTKNCVTPLNAGTYRVAMRLELNSAKIYFRKSGERAFGPFPVPEGNLRLMMLPQGGYGFPAATLLHAGSIYQGSGGLF